MNKVSFTVKLIGTLLSVIGAIFLILTLAYHGVSNEVTEADRESVPRYVTESVQIEPAADLSKDIELIKKVQDSVLNVAPVNKGIPYGQPREPKDLLEAKQGLSFDRSRVIEKILRAYGYETRHVFIYSTKRTGSSVRSFITPGAPSHAVSEVWTANGWLVVESNDRWISLDSEGNPREMEEIVKTSGPGGGIEWKDEAPKIYKELYPYTFVYGLYSRHGEFYPPYNPIPDVNYGELLYNFY
ncbi:MAG TPA: transglutaminase domain-containing protein [Aridibacter sp.]|nr:transglutaminase domain-containing protein [Aridibacter sp.]